MRIIKPSYNIMDDIDADAIMRNLEKFGRICYKSEDRTTSISADSFISKIIRNGHESVIEHEKISVKIICDRGVSHEIVRHRIASYSQESTRFCNYASDNFSNELTFIKPVFWDEESDEYKLWYSTMLDTEEKYLLLISKKIPAEQARAILPNSLKTEIVVTMNLREWRHFFKLRTSRKAHPQMREICIPLLKEFQEKLPVIFGDINVE